MWAFNPLVQLQLVFPSLFLWSFPPVTLLCPLPLMTCVFFKLHSSSVLCCRACVLAQCSGLSLWFLLFSPANIKVCFWFIWTALRFWILFLNSVIHDTLSDFQFLKKVLIINWTFHLTAQDYSSDSLLHFHELVGCLRLCTSARQKIPSSACVTWSKRISGSKLVCDIFVRTSRWRPVLTGYVFWKVWDRMGTARWCCGWHCYLTKILRQQFLCTLSVLVWVISGYSSFIPQSEVMHVLGYLSGSELTISMTVRVNGYLSLSYPSDDVNLSSQLYL